jgi:hypothetical protein
VSEASLTVQIDWGCQEENLFGGVTAGNDSRAISDGNGLQSNTPFSSKHPVDDFLLEAADAMKESDHFRRREKSAAEIYTGRETKTKQFKYR